MEAMLGLQTALATTRNEGLIPTALPHMDDGIYQDVLTAPGSLRTGIA